MYFPLVCGSTVTDKSNANQGALSVQTRSGRCKGMYFDGVYQLEKVLLGITSSTGADAFYRGSLLDHHYGQVEHEWGVSMT